MALARPHFKVFNLKFSNCCLPNTFGLFLAERNSINYVHVILPSFNHVSNMNFAPYGISTGVTVRT